MSCEIFSQDCCVCVGVIAADDDDCCNAVLLAYFSCDCELFFCLELCSAGSDDVKSASVSELIDIFIVKDQIVVIQESARTVLESVKNIFFICCFQSIVKSADNIVSAGSLSA